MMFYPTDGGREEAGFKGSAGDCAVRAVAIATAMPYREAYEALSEHARSSRVNLRMLRKRYGDKAEQHLSPRLGMYREVLDEYLQMIGWRWVPTMRFGHGCEVHLTEEELPGGWLIVRVSRHFTAVCDGVIYDTHDPSRDGTRCVYGFWQDSTKEA